MEIVGHSGYTVTSSAKFGPVKFIKFVIIVANYYLRLVEIRGKSVNEYNYSHLELIYASLIVLTRANKVTDIYHKTTTFRPHMTHHPTIMLGCTGEGGS